MLVSLYLLLTSKNPNLFYLRWLIIMAIITLLFILYTRFLVIENVEGFDQKDSFVIKRNDGIYDDYYLDVYNELHEVSNRTNEELLHILKTTSPSTEKSVFLDVGSGTGHVVNELHEAGFNAYGIDKSSEMIKYSQKSFPEIEVLHGDVLEPMIFEKNTFTHILCNYFTLYHMENKDQFFQNCYHWLQPGGYLILHLVNKDKFENIIPHTNAISKREPTKRGCNVCSSAGFKDTDYNGVYEINNTTDVVVFVETFTNIHNKKVRKNEQNVYLEGLDKVLQKVKRNGFIHHAQTDMVSMNGDKHQYLYYFERPL